MAGRQLAPSSLRRMTEALDKQQCRHFTSMTRKDAAQFGQMRAQLSAQMKRQRSLQSQMTKMKKGEMPTDMGLLPDTLLKPLSKDLPAIFSDQWKKRLRIEWRAFYQPIVDMMQFVYLTKWVPKKDPLTKKRPKVPFYLSDRYAIARDLHRRLYCAIAEGDRETLEKIACTGLQRELAIRLGQRKALNLPAETWTIQYKGWTPKSLKSNWFLQAFMPGFAKSTRIIADRMTMIPIGQKGSLRQVFVNIRSRQTLDKHDETGVKSVDKEEIVVIQKMIIDGQEDDWMIWGTTQPSSKETIDDILNVSGQKGPGIVEKFKDQMSGIMAKQGSS